MELQEYEDILKILHEDNHIIVVVKPQNVPSQQDSSMDKDMLSLVKEYLKLKYNKPGNVYCGLVHRLDRPTGGVMVFAKTDKGASRLSEQIRAGEMDKRYFAVVSGMPRDRVGRVRSFLLKDAKNNVVKSHTAKVEGSKEAVLDYKVVADSRGLSLVDINLITGRSHQARVQMKSLGTPIFGDVKYGGDKTIGKGHNLALWAYSLTFCHPTTKEIMIFKVFPPQELLPWSEFAMEKHIPVAKPND